MYTKKSLLTSGLNCRVSEKIRKAIQDYALRENLSMSEAARHFLTIGIKNQEATP